MLNVNITVKELKCCFFCDHIHHVSIRKARSLSKVQKQSGRIKELVLQELECSVSELHLLLRTLAETADTCLTIDGSCSITQHDGDIVKDEPEIRLKQLTVKANMSSQSLQALLKPLAVGSVYIHDCNILNEGQENNLFTEQKEVCSCFMCNYR